MHIGKNLMLVYAVNLSKFTNKVFRYHTAGVVCEVQILQAIKLSIKHGSIINFVNIGLGMCCIMISCKSCMLHLWWNLQLNIVHLITGVTLHFILLYNCIFSPTLVHTCPYGYVLSTYIDTHICIMP